MGGYVIARESRDLSISRYMSSPKCSTRDEREGQLGGETMRTSIRVDLGNDDGESTYEVNKSSRVVDGYSGYELLPNIAHGAFFLIDENGTVAKDHCRPLTTPPGVNLRQRQMNPPRSAAVGRINKPRRISPNNQGEVPKASDSTQRSELPKTPMSWSSEDDLLLRDLKELRKLGWKEISAYFPKRTAHACQFRWRRLVSGTLKGHKQCPPQASNRPSLPCLTIPMDQTIVKSTNYIGAFESPLPITSKMFDISSTDSESTQSRTPLVISSPSSPSYLSEPAPYSDSEVPRSGTSSPSHLRQRYIVATNMEAIRGQEASDLEGEGYLEYKHLDVAFVEKHRIHTSAGRKYSSLTPNSLLIQGTWDSQNIVTENSPSDNISWTSEEDSLLLNRRLSFDEVSILLHHRSEEAIWSRMGILRSSVPKSMSLECTS